MSTGRAIQVFPNTATIPSQPAKCHCVDMGYENVDGFLGVEHNGCNPSSSNGSLTSEVTQLARLAQSVERVTLIRSLRGRSRYLKVASSSLASGYFFCSTRHYPPVGAGSSFLFSRFEVIQPKLDQSLIQISLGTRPTSLARPRNFEGRVTRPIQARLGFSKQGCELYCCTSDCISSSHEQHGRSSLVLEHIFNSLRLYIHHTYSLS